MASKSHKKTQGFFAHVINNWWIIHFPSLCPRFAVHFFANKYCEGTCVCYSLLLKTCTVGIMVSFGSFNYGSFSHLLFCCPCNQFVQKSSVTDTTHTHTKKKAFLCERSSKTCSVLVYEANARKDTSDSQSSLFLWIQVVIK